jgi:hypothetical protein
VKSYTTLMCGFIICSILSFGAPQPNVYKIVVDGREAMLFLTTQVCKNIKKSKI